MQPVSVAPGSASDSDSIAVPLSLSDSATVPVAKLLVVFAVVASYAAQVCAPARTPMSAIAASVSTNLLDIDEPVPALAAAGFPGEVVRAGRDDRGVGAGGPVIVHADREAIGDDVVGRPGRDRVLAVEPGGVA